MSRLPALRSRPVARPSEWPELAHELPPKQPQGKARFGARPLQFRRFRSVHRTRRLLCGRLSERRDSTMSEPAVERRTWASDIVWVVFYSILVFVVMLLWAYVPA